jgi:hypothetical protein
MCDLLWSDPDEENSGWEMNIRGAGYLYGCDIVDQFNHVNNFSLITRAHQLQDRGFTYLFNEALVTVWSAPNYCYRCGNVASVLQVDENLNRNFVIFGPAPVQGESTGTKQIPDYFL